MCCIFYFIFLNRLYEKGLNPTEIMFVHKLFQTAPFTHMYPWWQLATHEISHERKTSGVLRDCPPFLDK